MKTFELIFNINWNILISKTKNYSRGLQTTIYINVAYLCILEYKWSIFILKKIYNIKKHAWNLLNKNEYQILPNICLHSYIRSGDYKLSWFRDVIRWDVNHVKSHPCGSERMCVHMNRDFNCYHWYGMILDEIWCHH